MLMFRYSKKNRGNQAWGKWSLLKKGGFNIGKEFLYDESSGGTEGGRL